MRTIERSICSRESYTRKISLAVLRDLSGNGSVPARDICSALQSGDYHRVVEYGIDPGDYTSPELFSQDYLAISLLRKFDQFPLGIDTKQVALDKFLESEAACKLINRTNVRPYEVHTCGVSVESYISHAQNKIRSLLGTFDWNQAEVGFGFSGGASTRLKRVSGAPFYKYQGKPETTRNNALLSICAIWRIPRWKEQMESAYGLDPCNWVTIVDGSKLTTVAKTAKTDRCIAIEPDMNMFIQRGIGSVIRAKLRSVGINLNDQTLNQKLAKIGSETGSLVTIDLASASDSISLELVRLLLPHDWFEALCLCRSEYGIFPNGVKHRFEKISSMGNGYTFELESLIFWALAKSVLETLDVGDRRLGIYGDDIVIHNSCADELIKLLDYVGFKTNVDKTFLSGPFRESCGKHYFYGRDVTPFYIKTTLEPLHRRFWVGNAIRLWSSRDASKLLQKPYDYVVSSVPSRHRYSVPMSLGSDVGFWSSFDECVPRFHPWKQAFSTKLLTSRRRKHQPNGSAAVLHYFNGIDPKPREINTSYGSGPITHGGVAGASSGTMLEKGLITYYHSKVYVSWWDAAPCGVQLGLQFRSVT